MAKIRRRKPSNVPASSRIADEDYTRARQGYNEGVVTHGELYHAAHMAGRNVIDLTDGDEHDYPSSSTTILPASRSRGERFVGFMSALRPGKPGSGIQSLLNQGEWRNSGAEAPAGGRAPKPKPIDTGYFG